MFSRVSEPVAASNAGGESTSTSASTVTLLARRTPVGVTVAIGSALV